MLHRHGILNKIWMIDQAFADNYFPMLVSYMKGNRDIIERNEITEILYHSSGNTGEQPVGVIEINGAITKHDQFCGPEGMVSVGRQIKMLQSRSESVRGLVLKIDSGGGEGYAMRHLIDIIKDRTVPIVAFVDDFAYSAAYGIAAACDVVVANSNLAGVGSIGTYMTFVDYREQLKKEGIDIKDIYASESKDKNSAYREAMNGNFEPIRKLADKFNDAFIAHIQESRGDKLADKKEWATGKTFFAEKAMELGLIDAIDKFENVLNYFA